MRSCFQLSPPEQWLLGTYNNQSIGLETKCMETYCKLLRETKAHSTIRPGCGFQSEVIDSGHAERPIPVSGHPLAPAGHGRCSPDTRLTALATAGEMICRRQIWADLLRKNSVTSQEDSLRRALSASVMCSECLTLPGVFRWVQVTYWTVCKYDWNDIF